MTNPNIELKRSSASQNEFIQDILLDIIIIESKFKYLTLRIKEFMENQQQLIELFEKKENDKS